MRSFLILAALLLLAPGAAAQEMAPFQSVTLADGGGVTLVQGPAQRVTVLEGAGSAEIRVVEGRLLIGHCRTSCPRGERRLRVEVVTPGLAEIAVANGGMIRAREGFPRQAELVASVTSGGILDLRALPAGRVRASVSQGGVILLSAEASLDASVEQGGRITYWGRPGVHSRVRGGGVVERGLAAEFTRAPTDLGPGAPPPVPPLPPLPLAPGL
ncbi:MAG TPA: DUF2807 domain-containing protein [Allosphingosinicella sp.]|nr:DUF2807 domain-containing protein [Allosphingosinicella sp.]